MSKSKETKHFGALIIDEVLQLRNQGKTKREIVEFFQLRNVKSVTNLLSRYRVQKEKMIYYGLFSKEREGVESVDSMSANSRKEGTILN